MVNPVMPGTDKKGFSNFAMAKPRKDQDEKDLEKLAKKLLSTPHKPREKSGKKQPARPRAGKGSKSPRKARLGAGVVTEAKKGVTEQKGSEAPIVAPPLAPDIAVDGFEGSVGVNSIGETQSYSI